MIGVHVVRELFLRPTLLHVDPRGGASAAVHAHLAERRGMLSPLHRMRI